MNILTKIYKRIKGEIERCYVGRKKKELRKAIANTDSPHLYFFSTPVHSNLGDQAQLMCWLRLFKEWYPKHEVICIPARYREFSTLRDIRCAMTPDDKIFIHSGYLIFDPHPELPFILDVVRAFYDYPITILPQTVNLMGEWYRQVVARQFNAHQNLTLICRDEVSFEKAKALFPKVMLKLMPDVVTSLIGDKDFQYNSMKRDGIMICVRNDGEKLYTEEEIESLKNRFKGIRVSQSDTTITASMWKWEKEREALIRKILSEFAQYQVIITDRYHGTIFSQVVNTPVIVLSSTDHKLSSGVKWFPKEVFGDMIQFAANLDEAYSLATKMINGPKHDVNPPYFKETYYQTRL